MIAAGIDTHKDAHTLCVVDELGRRVSCGEFRADPGGYAMIAEAIGDPAGCAVVGVEGTASYGAGVFRHLSGLGYNVVEVLRPKRPRRRPGEPKSDAADAERAALDALGGRGTSVPKSQDGWVEQARALLAARQACVRTCVSCVNAARAMLVTAPEGLRERYRGMGAAELMRSLCRGRACADPARRAVLDALRALARVWREARAAADGLEGRIAALVGANAPALAGVYGCGPISAARLAVAAGDNPGRVRSEAAFASLCGAAPVEASSGKTARHRLSRGGDRQANSALHQIAVVRLRHDGRTREYAARRRAEGKSRKEVLRCLKRYIAREVYRALLDPRGDGGAPEKAG